MREFKFVDKKLRLEIKQLADEIRLTWALKGRYDILDIIEEYCLLIRRPEEKLKKSGFSMCFDDQFVVFLNSSYSLGHERFTAAHELYHLIFDKELLESNKILVRDDNKDSEKRADIFAAEFLMPEDGVRDFFYKMIDIDPKCIEAKHIIIMQQKFNVSYSAMLRTMINLNLCDSELYEDLRSIADLGKEDKLQNLTKLEGYSIDLIVPSNISYYSREFLAMIRRNYEDNKITYKKLEELLNFIGKTPAEFGYEVSYGRR